MNQTDTFALGAFLPYRLSKLADSVNQDFYRKHRDKYGISRHDWCCFALIGELGQTTATTIVNHCGMHKTKVSRSISALETQGWIRRWADDNDRRVEIIALTPAGREIYAEIARNACEFERAILQKFNAEDREQIGDWLTRMEKRFNGR